MALRQPLDPETHKKLAALARSLPERQVREVIGGLSPEAYARALAGLSVTRGTIAQIQAGLAQHEAKAA